MAKKRDIGEDTITEQPITQDTAKTIFLVEKNGLTAEVANPEHWIEQGWSVVDGEGSKN